MKVDKIARLFLAQNGPALVQEQNASEATQSANSDSDAVTVNAGLGGGTETASSDDSARAAKVARLKDAVNSDSYRPDTNKVAASVYRELFI